MADVVITSLTPAYNPAPRSSPVLRSTSSSGTLKLTSQGTAPMVATPLAGGAAGGPRSGGCCARSAAARPPAQPALLLPSLDARPLKYPAARRRHRRRRGKVEKHRRPHKRAKGGARTPRCNSMTTAL